MDKRNADYDEVKRARAGGIATLRALVAGYMAYLAWQIVKGVRSGESTMAPAVGYAAAAFFLLAAAAFAVYLIRQWRLEVEAARLVASDETEDSAEDEG
jgi:TRAP-type C4-dicarboxylate transport system permease small subunit